MTLRRREFITLLGGAAAWPLAAGAQAMRRIGVLMGGAATNAATQSNLQAFVQALRQLGWIERQNVQIDLRWSAADAELAKIYTAQLIGLMPDVILANSTLALTVLREATSTIPVVFLQVSDPVAQGFVASMTKPGGNLTGFSQYEFPIGGKWLDLLKQAVPGLARVAVMFNPDTSPQSRFFMKAVESAGTSLGVQVGAAPVHATGDIQPALESLAREPNAGLMLPTDGFTTLRERLIIELATRHRLPAIATNVSFVKDGGLMYYGIQSTLLDTWRQAANYVDRILKGAKPGDLPVQAPTKYQLIINLRTAKAFGLTVPLTLRGLADEVIE